MKEQILVLKVLDAWVSGPTGPSTDELTFTARLISDYSPLYEDIRSAISILEEKELIFQSNEKWYAYPKSIRPPL